MIRAGLLVTGTWSPSKTPELPASLDSTCRSLVVPFECGTLGLRSLVASKLPLDGLWQGYSIVVGQPLELDLEPGQSLALSGLGINRPIRNPEALRRLRGLEQLDCGSGLLTADELYTHLPALELRRLRGIAHSNEQVRSILDACPSLEVLELGVFKAALAPMPGLERLRSLSLIDPSVEAPVGRLSAGVSLPRLESLTISRIDLDDIERIAALPRLRRLTVTNPGAEPDAIIEALAGLSELEHLELLWNANTGGNPAPLAKLSRLRTLTLWGLGGELDVPESLESLALGWSDVRVRGTVPTIQSSAALSQLLANVDLRGTTVLRVAPSRFNFEQFEGALNQLHTLDTLVMEHTDVQPEDVSSLGQHPRLRTIVLPNSTFDQQRQLGHRFGHLQIVGADEARLRTGFGLQPDLLAPDNWPKPRSRGC